MQDLTITLLQTSLAWHDQAANREHFAELVHSLPVNTDVAILPEMFTTGFTMDAATYAEPMSGPSVRWLTDLARERGVTLCGSLNIANGGQYFNRFLWATPDGQCQYYDKRHLFRMAGEHHHYTAGQQRLIVELNGWRICPMVCYDLRFPVWSRGINEFDLLVYVANWPAARRSAWTTLLPARAVENQCYVAGVNRVGSDGNSIAYAGDSSVHDFLGECLADLGAEPGQATVALSHDALTRYRQKFPAWQDADTFRLTPDQR
ncbi:MAG: amidohydrolase [Gammaproteobacteria bacterium]